MSPQLVFHHNSASELWENTTLHVVSPQLIFSPQLVFSPQLGVFEMRESDLTLIPGPELWAPQLGPTTRRVMPPKAAEVDPDHKEAGGRTSGVPHWTPVENMVRRALPGLWGPTGRRLCTNRCWWGPKTRRAGLMGAWCAALRRACSPSLLPMRPRRSRLWFSEEALPNLRIGYPQGTGSVGPRFGSVRLIVCGVPFMRPSWRQSRPAHAPAPAPQQPAPS